MWVYSPVYTGILIQILIQTGCIYTEAYNRMNGQHIMTGGGGNRLAK